MTTELCSCRGNIGKSLSPYNLPLRFTPSPTTSPPRRYRTGTDVLRQALSVRNRKINIAAMARDLGIANAALDAFAFGQAGLPPETLKALATHLFGEIDMLRPTTRAESRPLGNAPAPVKASGKVYPIG